jgi:hypothetical protein
VEGVVPELRSARAIVVRVQAGVLKCEGWAIECGRLVAFDLLVSFSQRLRSNLYCLGQARCCSAVHAAGVLQIVGLRCTAVEKQ